MGVLRYDGGDWVRFSTLASSLSNTSDGAWTCAVLLKQAVDTATFQAYSYLCSSGPTTEAGFSREATGRLQADVSGHTGTGGASQDIAGTTETYIAVAHKGAGTVDTFYKLYSRSTTTWSTDFDSATTLPDQIASTMLEIGTWQGGSDLANAWIGLVAFWEGSMSNTNIETLDNNWQTSDWYSNAHGAPTFLCEGNVAAASLVDLMGNASGLSVTGTPTLDGAETLSTWNFNGTGAAATVPVAPQRRVFPIRLARFHGTARRGFLSFPLPYFDAPPAGDVLVATSAATALGFTSTAATLVDVAATAALAAGTTAATTQKLDKVTTAALAAGSTVPPAFLVTVPTTAALAAGSTSAPAVAVASVPTSATALGGTLAPTVLVVVPVTSATAIGTAPSATAVIGAGNITVTPSAALALGSTPAPLVLVTVSAAAALAAGTTSAPVAAIVKAATAALAAGTTTAPVVLVVVPVTAATAIGTTPAPTVITGSGSTVSVNAAVAIGSAPAPTVQVTVAPTVALALGSAPVAQPGKTIPVTAAIALGSSPSTTVRVTVLPSAATAQGVTPSPVVIAGILFVPASLTVTDTGTVAVTLTDASGATVTLADGQAPTIAVVDASTVAATVGDRTGADVTVTDRPA